MAASNTLIKLSIRLNPKGIFLVFPMLQKGFIVNALLGQSIKTLLCEDIKLSEDYVEERIQTVFLNGKAVDDINTSLVSDGAVIALSAAMPGLVGAAFRKSGTYSSLRRQVSEKSDSISISKKEGKLTIKLFNLIAKEIGPLFLGRGIYVKGEEIGDLLTSGSETFFKMCKSVHVNDQLVDAFELSKADWENHDVLLELILDET